MSFRGAVGGYWVGKDRVKERLAASDSWWLSGGISAANAIAVYQPKGADDLADSYVNLANPGTYNAAPGVAPTWASGTGWTFNGSTQYLDSGVTVTSTYSVIGRLAGWSGWGNSPFGCVNPLNGHIFRINAQQAGGSILWYNLSSTLQVTGTVTDSVLALGGTIPYRDGVALAATSGLVGTPNSLYVGAHHNTFGNPDTFMTGQIAALAIYDTTLTAPQVAAVSAAMAAL